MSETSSDTGQASPETLGFNPVGAVDLAKRELLEHNLSLNGVLPDDAEFYVSLVVKSPPDGGEPRPFVVTHNNVGWGDRTGTTWHLHGVEGATDVRFGSKQQTAIGMPGVFPLAVYDIDPEQLMDASIPGKAPELVRMTNGHGADAPSDNNILMAPTPEDAQSIGSWMADPHQRARVQQWFDVSTTACPGENDEQRAARIARYEELERFILLREAADRTRTGQPSVPGFDVWDYAGVKQEATKTVELDRTFTVLGEDASLVTHRRFEPRHLEWLETFMHNQDIPIPADN